MYLPGMPPRAAARAASARETAGREGAGRDDPLRLVQEAIASGRFAPVYYLFGDDDFLKDAAVRDLLAAAIDPATRDFNCEVRRAAELDAETLGSLLATPPMLAERRAVVVRDVTALRKAARQVLDRHLAHPAPDTLLLLLSPAGTRPDAPLAAQAVALAFEPLSPDRVRRWIAHHARTVLGAIVDDDAVTLLQQAVGNDLQLLASELDKCASYAQARAARGHAAPADGGGAGPALRIDTEAVAAVVGIRRGETVTDLLDAVAARDAARAVALVGHVLGQPKVTAVQVVMMLSTQAFAIAFGRARRDAGVPTNRLPAEFFAFLKDTGGYPGRPWGEAASAWTRVVDRWPSADCTAALALLLEADIALKETTVSNAEQILTSLVLALCATGQPRRRAA